MARTKTPAPEKPPATPQTPPDPPAQDVARPSPVLAWPAEWPVPELPAEKQRRSRGLPMGPVLAGAGNGTTMVTTAAYSAGGPAAAAAAGVVVAAGVTAMALRRRAAVRRGVAARAGGATSGGRGGAGGGLRGGSGSGATRSGGGSWRSAGGGRSGGGSATRGGGGRSGSGLRSAGSGSGLGGGARSGSGASRSGLLRGKGGRHSGPGRGAGGGGGLRKDSSRRQKQAAEKAAAKAGKRAAEKALKQAAKKPPANAATPGKRHAVKAAAGRTARAAWNATRPQAVRVRQAAARQARRARGALWDGLCAAAAGAWTLLRRGRYAALDRLKSVWKRRRKDRSAPAAPTVAATVRRPTQTQTRPSTGGIPMSGGGHHFVAPAMELARAAASYRPTGMLQVGADFAGLEEALRLHAEAMKITVENADATQPLDPNIIEIMRQVHGLQLKAAELASELQPAFRQLHDVDISRLENPRKGIAGERMWDVASNL